MIDEIYKALTEKTCIGHEGVIILEGTIKHANNFSKYKGKSAGNVIELKGHALDTILEKHKEHNGTEGCLVLNHERPDDDHYRFVLLSNNISPENVQNYASAIFLDRKVDGYIFKKLHSPRDHTNYRK